MARKGISTKGGMQSRGKNQDDYEYHAWTRYNFDAKRVAKKLKKKGYDVKIKPSKMKRGTIFHIYKRKKDIGDKEHGKDIITPDVIDALLEEIIEDYDEWNWDGEIFTIRKDGEIIDYYSRREIIEHFALTELQASGVIWLKQRKGESFEDWQNRKADVQKELISKARKGMAKPKKSYTTYETGEEKRKRAKDEKHVAWLSIQNAYDGYMDFVSSDGKGTDRIKVTYFDRSDEHQKIDSYEVKPDGSYKYIRTIDLGEAM